MSQDDEGNMNFALRNQVLPDERGVIVCCLGRFTLEGVKIDLIETKSCSKSLKPFVVVHERPVEITPNVHSFLQASFKDFYMFLNKSYLLLIVRSSNSVLRYDQGDIQLPRFF
jgi:hypothetical protein